MKFLVIAEGVPEVVLPPEQAVALGRENWAWVRKMTAAGKLDVAFGLADHAGGILGGCGIANVESLEELGGLLASLPVVAISNVKVYPLVAPEVVEKLIDVWAESIPKT